MLRKLGTTVVALCMVAGFSMVACSDDDGGAECGDGVIEGTEVCDDTNVDGRTCTDEGFTGGALVCNATCDDYDTSGCTNTADVCGDGDITGNEDCEGTDLDNTTCEDLNFDGGTLACDNCAFDDSGCTMDCTDDCTAEDDTQCTGNILGTCTVGADDCLDWVDTDCTDAGQICDASGATAVCADDCTSDCTTIGVTECIDATNLDTCTDSGNGCMNWTASACTGGYCAGDPAVCETTGTGTDCDDVYNLNGRTFPHTLTGIWDTGDYTFQGTCQDGAHPIYLSYTVQSSGIDSLVFVADEQATWAYPQVSAWTTTEATGFCTDSLMTEIGCADDSSDEVTLVLDGSDLAQGDVIYFLLSGDGASWELNDPEITIIEHACGNGGVYGSESCDDGNLTNGDGCDANCIAEPGYDCTGEPSSCTQVCGNSTIDATASEQCDDGNLTAGDGCDANCQSEAGYWCTGEPSSCTQVCGNSTIDATANEQCDDSNLTAGDGCDANCQVESGYYCSGEPSTCVTTTVLLTEDFSSWIPTGWTIEDGSSDSNTWIQCEADLICDRSVFDGADGAVGAYALIDSDDIGSVALSEGLVTPSIDCSSHSNVLLSFDHNFQQYDTAGDQGLVEVSTDGGTNWTQVALYTADTSQDGEHVVLDISPVAGSQANVTIRFHYTGNYDWYWMIDSIEVFGL